MNPRVLVVDDDQDCLDALGTVLVDVGYRVSTARNGREALDQIREQGAPCIVVLDLLMPVMSGAEFLEHRKADPLLARTPVVIVTATDAKLESRTDPVLRKPIDFDQLLRQIEHACGPAH
jgi:CheY-like chemotaxis protein